MPTEANVELQFTAESRDAQTDIDRLKSEIKRIGKLQDDIGKKGIEITDNYRLKSGLAYNQIEKGLKRAIDLQAKLEKQGDKAPKGLQIAFDRAVKTAVAGLNKIDTLQNKVIRDHETGIKQNQAARDASFKKTLSNIKKEEAASQARWREEQRLFAHNVRQEERAHRQRIRRQEELLIVTSQIGREIAQLGRRMFAFSLDTIEASKFFELLHLRLTVIEGSAEKASVQMKRFLDAARLPGVDLTLLDRFATQMGRVGVKGEELVKFTTDFGNSVALWGLTTIEGIRALRQMTDTIDKQRASQLDLNSILESGQFLADHIKTALDGQALSAENLNKKVAKLSGGYKEFWLQAVGGSLADEVRVNGDLILVAQQNLEVAILRLKGALGDELAPAYKLVTRGMEELALQFENLPGPIKSFISHVSAIGGITLSAGGSLAAFAADIALIGFTLKGTAIASKIGGIGAAIAALAATIVSLPVSIIIGLIVVISGLVIGLANTWQASKDAEEALKDTKEAIEEIKKVGDPFENMTFSDVTKELDRIRDDSTWVVKGAKNATEVFEKLFGMSGSDLDKEILRIATGVDGTTEKVEVLKNALLELVKADDKLARARFGVQTAETIDQINAAAEELRKALTTVATLEIEEVDAEIKAIDEKDKKEDDDIKERQRLVARRKEIQLQLDRDLLKSRHDQANAIQRIHDKADREEEKRRKDQTRAEEQAKEDLFKWESNQLQKGIQRDKDISQRNQKAITEREEFARSESEKTADENLEAAIRSGEGIREAIVSYSNAYHQAYMDRKRDIEDSTLTEEEKITALSMLYNEYFNNIEKGWARIDKAREDYAEKEKSATLELAEFNREQAEKTAINAVEKAVAMEEGETEALHTLTSLYRKHYEERVKEAREADLTETQLKLRLRQLEIQLLEKLKSAHALVYDSAAVDLAEIKQLIQDITQATRDWGEATETTGDKVELTFQNYVQFGQTALSSINDIIDAHERLGDSLDRIDQRTERSINRIKQRAMDQGRPLTLQEQRRIQEIQEDAATSRERARETASDSYLQTGFTVAGATIGTIVGSFVGNPMLGFAIGSGVGRETGRLAGNLFHEPHQDMFAGYAGERVAKMTTGEMRQRNTKNAADFSEYFSKDFGVTLAKEMSKTMPAGGGPVTINLNATLKLDSGSTNLIVEDIVTGQGNGSIAKWPNKSLAGV